MTDQNLTPEAVERLAALLDMVQDDPEAIYQVQDCYDLPKEAAAVLRTLDQQNAALQAEVERLTEELEHMTACKDIHQTKRHEYFMRAEKAEAERDVAKKLLRSCIKGNNALREAAQERKSERDEARAMLADAERDMRQRAADVCKVYWDHPDAEASSQVQCDAILALPLKHADREGGV